jgi:hypothetical protein
MRRSSGAHFDGFLRENGSKFLVCRSYTYPDRSLFQIVESLRYAFPKAMVRLKRRHRGLTAGPSGSDRRPGVHPSLSEFAAASRILQKWHIPALSGTGRLTRNRYKFLTIRQCRCETPAKKG